MTPEQREQVKDLFDLLCDATDEVRRTQLTAKGLDPVVREETERLLRAYDAEPSYLEHPPENLVAEALETPAVGDPTYEPGQVVGGRFRIKAFLGQGGMGEVYEAEDLLERNLVALKTLRQDFSAQPEMQKRFRQEVALAKKVTDPHVCRIDALHSEMTANDELQLFLSMELLDGKRLSEKRGPLQIEEALAIAGQIARGLAAAHRAGVIHRDLKTGNIMLTRDPDRVTRAVIMDFGIARPCLPATDTPKAEMLGTLEYMAPEQFSGEATPASDIYAFGVILHEMLMGKKPAGPPRSLRTSNLFISRELEKIVLRCLAHDPAHRYANGTELVAALETVTPGQAWFRAWPVTAALLFLLAMAVTGAAYFGRGGLRYHGLAGTSPGRVAAVLDFRNLNGRPESAYLGRALASALSAELAASSDLRVVPGEDAARAQTDLGLENVATFSQPTLEKIRANLDASVVISGAYLASGGRVRVYAGAQDTSSGKSIANVTQDGVETDLPDLFARLGQMLSAKLGLSPEGRRVVSGTQPVNLDALKFYSEGMRQLTSFRPLAASQLFAKAIAAEHDYAPAHAALARAYNALGFEDRAKQEAKRAYELSSSLDVEDRLQIEAEYYDAFGESAAARAIYEKLSQAAPDRLDYKILLAEEETPKQGAALLEKLRRSSSKARNNPQVDLALVHVYNHISDYPQMETAARRAIARAQEIGASSVMAEAELFLAGALRIMGRRQEAEKAYEEAKRLYFQLRNESGEARAFRGLAVIKYYAGDVRAARELYQQALVALRAVGNESGIATVLNGLAMVESSTGQLKKAEELYTQSLQICEKIHDGTGTGRALNNLGYIKAHLGDLAGARARLEESLRIYEREDAHWGLSVSLNNLGDVLAFQGDLKGANRDQERSLAEARKVQDKSGEASCLFSLGKLRESVGNLAEAQGLLEESLKIRTSLHEKENQAATSIALAQLFLREKKPGLALQSARDAVATLAGNGNPDSRAEAKAVLASAQAASGIFQDARNSIAQAQKLATNSQDVPARLTVEAEAARVLGLTGDPAGKRRMLAEVCREAAQFGFHGMIMDFKQ